MSAGKSWVRVAVAALRNAKAPSGWEIYKPESDEVHVTPFRDQTAHELTQDCLCGPNVDYSGLRPLVTHHSLDGREAKE